jgi:uncharacterized sulfatase
MKSLRRSLAAFLAAGATLAVGSPAVPPADRPPVNVLLILVDDLNVALGCYGHPTVQSPNIDRLAARGVRFDRAYCQYPLCNPSRVSLLSGRRPETTGVYILTTAARTALPNAVMLPQYFRQHGYFTGGAGKVFHSPKVNDALSWDFYEDGPGSDPQEQAAIKQRAGGDGQPTWHVLDGDGSQTRDGTNAQTIARLIAEQHAAGKPFLLAAGFHKPHLPWTAPRRFFDLYPAGSIKTEPEPAMRDIPAIAMQTELTGFAPPDSREAAMSGYYACVSFTDHQVGVLLNQLDQLQLWDNTVVVLLGDNGFHLGDHGGLWAKLSAFDAATHVPLIMAGAGVPRGQVVANPVELLDVYPTLLELAGFPADAGLEGRSLVATMGGRTNGAAPAARSMVFHYDVATKRDVLSRTLIGPQWRYTEWADGTAGREFYWRPDDPREYVNRVADPALSATQQAAREELARLPAPKPGPANRPRALSPNESR